MPSNHGDVDDDRYGLRTAFSSIDAVTTDYVLSQAAETESPVTHFRR